MLFAFVFKCLFLTFLSIRFTDLRAPNRVKVRNRVLFSGFAFSALVFGDGIVVFLRNYIICISVFNFGFQAFHHVIHCVKTRSATASVCKNKLFCVVECVRVTFVADGDDGSFSESPCHLHAISSFWSFS